MVPDWSQNRDGLLGESFSSVNRSYHAKNLHSRSIISISRLPDHHWILGGSRVPDWSQNGDGILGESISSVNRSYHANN